MADYATQIRPTGFRNTTRVGFALLSPPYRSVTAAATYPLTSVPNSDTTPQSCSPKGRQTATPADGARAVPAGGGSSPPLPGGSGYIRPAGTMTGLRGNPLDWDGRERVTPAPTEFRPRKRVTGAERWRSVAAASAVVERRQASARRFARAAPVWRGGWTTRLPAFCFLFICA
jgi:hypothetical protein